MYTTMSHSSRLISLLWLQTSPARAQNTQYALSHSVTETIHKSIDMLYKNTLDVKKRGQVGSTCYFYFLHATKDVISDRGQGLLRSNHFVDAAIYNHVQTNSNNACSQTIKTSTNKEPMYDHG